MSRVVILCASAPAAKRHGPVWYLSVTLGPGRTTGGVVPAEQMEQVQRWIENYRHLKGALETISEINRELLRRQQNALRARKRKKGAERVNGKRRTSDEGQPSGRSGTRRWMEKDHSSSNAGKRCHDLPAGKRQQNPKGVGDGT